MTDEKMYEHICTMIREHDESSDKNNANRVIEHPDRWVSDWHPFYASAAELLIEIRSRMDAEVTPRARQSALRRILKNCPSSRPSMAGIFSYGDCFVICDGYRLIRLRNDISSLPHVKNDFDVGTIMQDIDASAEPLQLPRIGELRAYIAAHKVRRGRKMVCEAYCLGDYVWCDPKYLLDMLQALPGCTAYMPKSPISPIYFTEPNGDDGLLLPVRHYDG